MRRILGVIGVTLAAGLVMTASAASATNRGGTIPGRCHVER